MKIYIASDHAGFQLKSHIIKSLAEYKVEDLGCYSEESVDYPDCANKLVEKLTDESGQFGILICGSGVGISIAANRHKHIRAALCYNEEIAALARKHNNANVIVFGARFISAEMALSSLQTFLSTEFEGGRHKKRISKL